MVTLFKHCLLKLFYIDTIKSIIYIMPSFNDIYIESCLSTIYKKKELNLFSVTVIDKIEQNSHTRKHPVRHLNLKYIYHGEVW